ncbi:MAG: hypothetical protein ACTSU5_15675 [Promethearchaeota archaeon]
MDRPARRVRAGGDARAGEPGSGIPCHPTMHGLEAPLLLRVDTRRPRPRAHARIRRAVDVGGVAVGRGVDLPDRHQSAAIGGLPCV